MEHEYRLLWCVVASALIYLGAGFLGEGITLPYVPDGGLAPRHQTGYVAFKYVAIGGALITSGACLGCMVIVPWVCRASRWAKRRVTAMRYARVYRMNRRLRDARPRAKDAQSIPHRATLPRLSPAPLPVPSKPREASREVARRKEISLEWLRLVEGIRAMAETAPDPNIAAEIVDIARILGATQNHKIGTARYWHARAQHIAHRQQSA
ncbi:MAG: hypothetical protein AAB916_00540 [Patescibacteria group bacterium]